MNTGSSTVSILLNRGDGTFGGPAPIALDHSRFFDYSGIQTADFNSDGKLDLAVTGYNARLAVLLGNGDGTFHAPAYYASGGSPLSAVADFNSDGFLDVATGSGVDVLLSFGNGDGSFRPPQPYATGRSFLSSTVAVGDFNGDGKPDLAVANGDSSGSLADHLSSNTLTILLNTGHPVSPDFNLSAPSSTTPASVMPGQSATGVVTVTSLGAFSGTVALTCSVSPTATLTPRCSLSPQQVQVMSSGSSTSTLTVNTTGPSALLTHPAFGRDLVQIYAMLLPIFGSVWLALGLKARDKEKNKLPCVVICWLLVGSLASQMVACGGSGNASGKSGTPAGTYTITVTGSSGSQHTTSLTLIIQ